MENNKGPYIAVGLVAVLAAAGFYLVLEKFSAFQEDFKNFELSFELYKKEKAAVPVVEPSNQPTGGETKTQEPLPNRESAVIPTAILFQAQSSSSPESQVSLNVSIESLTRETNGTIEVALKVFNGNTQDYGRLDPISLFEIIDLQNSNVSQEPYKIEGAYDSIGPRSAVLGKVFFKISALENTMILRVGPIDTANFYEFNFQKKAYKEVNVG